MELPPEKLNELKQIIHSHLDQIDIHGRIRQCLDETLQHEEDSFEEEGLLTALKEKGIIEDVMKNLNFKDLDNQRKAREDKLKEHGNRSKLKGFLDYKDTDAYDKSKTAKCNKCVKLSICKRILLSEITWKVRRFHQSGLSTLKIISVRHLAHLALYRGIITILIIVMLIIIMIIIIIITI